MTTVTFFFYIGNVTARWLSTCLSILREGAKASGYPVVFVATTRDLEKVPAVVLNVFRHQVACEVML